VAKVFHQNTSLSDTINKENRMPSEKLKKDPIMELVTKMVATYMFIKHSNHGKKNQTRLTSPRGITLFSGTKGHQKGSLNEALQWLSRTNGTK
jgi:hypothetical protein